MKKIIFIILGTLSLILGVIGIALPIIPQIPFLLVGVCLLIAGSNRLKDRILGSKIYRTHVEPHLEHHKLLRRIWDYFAKQ